jgi:hypothetical protein
MTCRVARLSPDLLRVNVAFCCECGSADLEVCYTSKALGPHLCQICALSVVEFGVAESLARSAMTGQPVA